QRPADSAGRLASNRNHARRSASSIQTSSRLAVATSPWSSHTPCVSRMRSASRALSSRSSASMSSGVTYSASLSETCCRRPVGLVGVRSRAVLREVGALSFMIAVSFQFPSNARGPEVPAGGRGHKRLSRTSERTYLPPLGDRAERLQRGEADCDERGQHDELGD